MPRPDRARRRVMTTGGDSFMDVDPSRSRARRRAFLSDSERQGRADHRRLAGYRPGSRDSAGPGRRQDRLQLPQQPRCRSGCPRRVEGRRRTRDGGGRRCRRCRRTSIDWSSATLEAFGRIDILVNNAGITRDTLMMRMSEEDWDAVLDTNLKSTFLVTKAVVRGHAAPARPGGSSTSPRSRACWATPARRTTPPPRPA